MSRRTNSPRALRAGNRGQVISIGIFNVVKLPGDKVWLQVTAGPNAGEGMQCDELKLEAAIEKFFRKEF